jgi:hypothetical protein
MTQCGDSHELVSAAIHGGLVVAYVAMAIFHWRSTLKHIVRHYAEMARAQGQRG